MLFICYWQFASGYKALKSAGSLQTAVLMGVVYKCYVDVTW